MARGRKFGTRFENGYKKKSKAEALEEIRSEDKKQEVAEVEASQESQVVAN
jgi:hypothetical protein